MRVIKAMGKALLVILSLWAIGALFAFIVKVAQIDPMTALGVILCIGLFAAITIWFYFTDYKE